MNPLSTSKMSEFRAGSTQLMTEGVQVQDLFDKQKAYFATDATKTYEWRIDQLDKPRNLWQREWVPRSAK
jgi:hypothetical protein